MFRNIFSCAAFAAAVGVWAPAAPAAEAPAVAAAADLQFALSEIATVFHARTGREIRLTFGSSGNLFRQIREGAPFELFLSADEKFALALTAAGLAGGDGAIYAIGRICIVVPRDSAVKADSGLADLKAAAADGRLVRFAIANPEHAPYGRRAEEALRHAGLWDALRTKLVLAENVAQAAQFATSGGAQGGIVACSLALSPDVAKLGTFALIPDDWHEPLRQRMVLLARHGETAARFFAFLQSEPARAIMRRYGFALPGEPAM